MARRTKANAGTTTPPPSPVTTRRVMPVAAAPSLLAAVRADGHDPQAVTVVRPGLIEVTLR